MTSLRTLLTALPAVLLATSALAQTPTSTGTFNAWSTWSYTGSISGGSTTGKVCYMHASPTKMEPPTLDHGDVSFSVSRSIAEKVPSQANFVTGYPFKENSTVTVDIDGKKFNMFTQAESAWLLNSTDEAPLMAAMKAGKAMKVTGTSRRGNPTSYDYSLSGATAAINKINSECK